MLGMLMLWGALTVTQAAATGDARGTITYLGKSGRTVVTVKHAYLVTGPDVVSGRTMRRVVVSSVDVSAALKGCERMMCADGGIEEGLTIDFDVPPRLNYWFVANGQRVQYSGTADPKSVQLTADTQQRIAGTWTLDATAAGGPDIRIAFDAPLVKTIKER